jgi:hypothetical protein
MNAELSLVIERPAIAGEVLTLPQQAKALIVRDQESYDLVVELGSAAKAKETIITEFYKPRKAKARAAWQQWVDDEKLFLDPIMETKRICGDKIAVWDAEQVRIRAGAQRRADEETRRDREEQERLQRGEQRRLEAEARKAAEEERLRLALEFEQMGGTQEAEEILAEPIPEPVIEMAPLPPPTPAPMVAPTYQKSTSAPSRANWKAEVFDIKALCRAVVDGKVSETYVEANMVALNKRASAEKQTMNIPGVRAINVPVTSFRGR